MKTKNQSRNSLSDFLFWVLVGLFIWVIATAGCISAKPTPMPTSYHPIQVRMKFKYINDTIYYNQYRKIYLVQRKDGRYYSCN
jgi:hypothetical protein